MFRIFGRDAGFSALYTAYVTSARCVIPEAPYDLDALAALLAADHAAEPEPLRVRRSPPRARSGRAPRSSDVGEADAFGHRHKANVGEALAAELEARTGIETLASELTYDLRSGEPDSLDSMVATTFANVAMDLIARRRRRAGWSRSRTASTPTPRCPTRRSGRAQVDVAGIVQRGAVPAALRRQARRPDAARRPRRRHGRRSRPLAVEAGQRADRPGERRHVVVGVAAARSARSRAARRAR